MSIVNIPIIKFELDQSTEEDDIVRHRIQYLLKFDCRSIKRMIIDFFVTKDDIESENIVNNPSHKLIVNDKIEYDVEEYNLILKFYLGKKCVSHIYPIPNIKDWNQVRIFIRGSTVKIYRCDYLTEIEQELHKFQSI